MRKVTTQLPLIILAFLCLGNSSSFAATPIFTLNGGSVCENATVEIDITVSDFTEMISFQFTLGWDPTVMQISEISSTNATISDNMLFGAFTTESNLLTVSWYDANVNGISLAEDEVLFTLSFNAVGGNSTFSMLTFMDTPTVREVSIMENGEITLVNGVWNEGMIMVAQPELGSVEVTDDVNSGGNGAVDITMTNGTAPFTFAWETGQTTEDLVDVPVGDYTCVVTDDKGCVTEIGPFTVGNILGTNDIEGLIGVQLFPNPNDGHFNLTAQLENPQNVEVIIYNILGAKVYYKQTESTNITLDLDLSDLAQGSYIVQLRTIDGMHTQKMQVNR